MMSETKPLSTSTTVSNETTVQNSTSSTMEKFLNVMKAYDDQRETQIKTYKRKCEDQETMISTVKKCLQMDKLEENFETFKQETATKIKSFMDAITQSQNEKILLQRKNNELTKQLQDEKELRKKAEDRDLKLECQFILHKTVPSPNYQTNKYQLGSLSTK